MVILEEALKKLAQKQNDLETEANNQVAVNLIDSITLLLEMVTKRGFEGESVESAFRTLVTSNQFHELLIVAGSRGMIRLSDIVEVMAMPTESSDEETQDGNIIHIHVHHHERPAIKAPLPPFPDRDTWIKRDPMPPPRIWVTPGDTQPYEPPTIPMWRSRIEVGGDLEGISDSDLAGILDAIGKKIQDSVKGD